MPTETPKNPSRPRIRYNDAYQQAQRHQAQREAREEARRKQKEEFEMTRKRLDRIELAILKGWEPSGTA